MNKIFKSTSLIIIGDILAKLLTLLYLIPLGMIDSHLVDLMNMLILPFGLFIVVSNMGFSTIMSVEIVKNYSSDRTRVRSSVTITTIFMMISTFISMVAMIILAPFFASSQLGMDSGASFEALTLGIRIMSVGLVIFTVLSITRTILTSMGEYKVFAFGFFIEQFIKVLLVVALAYGFIAVKGINYNNFIFMVVFGTIVSMLFVLIMNTVIIIKNKYYDIFIIGDLKITKIAAKTILLTGFVFIASSFYATAFDNIDSMSMSTLLNMRGYSQIQIEAIYKEYASVGMKINMIPIQLAANFVLVMIREIADSKNKKHEFNNIMYTIIILSLVSMGGVIVLGPMVYYALSYGQVSIGILQFQSIIIVMYATKNILTAYVLTFEDITKTLIYSTVVIIVAKFAFLYSLIYVIDYYAFSASSFLALLCGMIVMIYMQRDNLAFDKEFYLNTIKAVSKIAIITIVFYIINENMDFIIPVIRLFMVGISMLIIYGLVLIPKDIRINYLNKLKARLR